VGGSRGIGFELVSTKERLRGGSEDWGLGRDEERSKLSTEWVVVVIRLAVELLKAC
jgi:hypothetical protein